MKSPRINKSRAKLEHHVLHDSPFLSITAYMSTFVKKLFISFDVPTFEKSMLRPERQKLSNSKQFN